MGRGPVQGHFRTDANPGHHIANLTDNMIAQQAAAIIFKDGKDHPV